MELDGSFTMENEGQFWDDLDNALQAQCDTHEGIDNALRQFLEFASSYEVENQNNELHVIRCACRLLESSLFAMHQDYIRRQIVHCFLQEEAINNLHILTAFLLCDGRQADSVLEMMNEEGCLARIVDLIPRSDYHKLGLQRMLLMLLYEMSRIQKLKAEELLSIRDEFVQLLFDIIEESSSDVNDPYHYPVIQVLLILNEQYMVAAHGQSTLEALNRGTSIPNKIVKMLANRGSVYKSFGQNMILLLNRENDTALQMLILKLLYLLFTSPPTFEYFYTNDLHVLLDIMLRNLLDLSSSSAPLQHLYLRTLYPFLAHSQLKRPPHYKRDEILRLLSLMVDEEHGHFGLVDETTQRLVQRCRQVSWLTV